MAAPGMTRGGVAGVFCALVLAWAAPAGAEEYVLKFGTVGPKGSSWADMAEDFKNVMREKTHGKVAVMIYAGGTMGDEPEIVQKMKTGVLQGAGIAAVGLSRIVPETAVLTLPFLFRDNAEIEYVLEKTLPYFTKAFEDKGFVFAGWTEVGFAYIFSQTPLLTTADLSTMKIWTWEGDSIVHDSLKAMGFTNIVPLPVQAVLSSLKSGRINAFYSPLYPCIGLQWFTEAKYVTSFKFAYSPGAVIIEKKALSRLPQEYQDLALRELKGLLKELAPEVRREEASSMKALEGSGISVVQTDPALVSSLKDKTRPLYEKYSGSAYPAPLLAKIRYLLEEYWKRYR